MKNPKKSKHTAQKIPLKNFLTLLNTLYSDGADFIDLEITITPDENVSDKVSIQVPLEYMTPESQQELLEEDNEFEEEVVPTVSKEDAKKSFTKQQIIDLLNG